MCSMTTSDRRDQADAGEHGETDADHGLDLAMDAETHDDAMQRQRDDDAP